MAQGVTLLDVTGSPPTPVGVPLGTLTNPLKVQMADGAGGVVTDPSANAWSYPAAAGGITNTTTAVPIKAAAGAGLRNYITALDLSTDGALGAATEVAIRDGAGGTVLWRRKIPAAGLTASSVYFPSPLKGTANTLLEVVTLTASVTGSVYFNAQGFVAA
jgi:hypothetical protein